MRFTYQTYTSAACLFDTLVTGLASAAGWVSCCKTVRKLANILKCSKKKVFKKRGKGSLAAGWASCCKKVSAPVHSLTRPHGQ